MQMASINVIELIITEDPEAEDLIPNITVSFTTQCQNCSTSVFQLDVVASKEIAK
jgi:hypothetical protein